MMNEEENKTTAHLEPLANAESSVSEEKQENAAVDDSVAAEKGIDVRDHDEWVLGAILFILGALLVLLPPLYGWSMYAKDAYEASLRVPDGGIGDVMSDVVLAFGLLIVQLLALFFSPFGFGFGIAAVRHARRVEKRRTGLALRICSWILLVVNGGFLTVSVTLMTLVAFFSFLP